MNRVAGAVRSLAGGIEGDDERTGSRLPWFLPRSDAALQHLYDVVGHLLAEVPKGFVGKPIFRGLGSSCGHGGYSSPPSSLEEKPGSGSSVSKPDPANDSPPIASSNSANESR